MASETKQPVTMETIGASTSSEFLIKAVKESTIREFEAVMAQGIYTGYATKEVGWLDGNKLMKSSDVFGYPYDPGLYYSMRYNHPIIKTLMDFKMNSVASLKYNVKPCDPENIESILAAEAVDFYLNRMPYNPLNDFIAETYDRVGTFGHAFYEMVLTEDGFYNLVYIPPATIEYITLDTQNYFITSVTQYSGMTQRTIPAWKLVWFGRDATLGAYYGTSDMRPLVAPFTAAEQIWQSFIGQVRYSKGILYAKETENAGESTTAESYRNVFSYLTKFYQGKDAPIILDRALELGFLAPDNPASSWIIEIVSYIDQQVRECLFSTLNSLGISGQGARALGESFSVSDAEKFADHVSGFMSMINGQKNPHSNLLEFITETCGYDKRYTPYIEVENTIEVKPEGRIELILKVIEAGILTAEEFGVDNKRALLEDLGFSLTAFNKMYGEPE